jgi:hypothetical protein
MAHVTAHVVTRPGGGRHHSVRMGDGLFLLVNALVSLRVGTPVALYDPPSPPDVCAKCSAAYREARAVIEAAGGLRAWAAMYEHAN